MSSLIRVTKEQITHAFSVDSASNFSMGAVDFSNGNLTITHLLFNKYAFRTKYDNVSEVRHRNLSGNTYPMKRLERPNSKRVK